MVDKQAPGPSSPMEKKVNSIWTKALWEFQKTIKDQQQPNKPPTNLTLFKLVGKYAAFLLAPPGLSPWHTIVMSAGRRLPNFQFLLWMEQKRGTCFQHTGLSRGCPRHLFLSFLNGSTYGNDGMVCILGWRLPKAVVNAAVTESYGGTVEPCCLESRDYQQRTTIHTKGFVKKQV